MEGELHWWNLKSKQRYAKRPRKSECHWGMRVAIEGKDGESHTDQVMTPDKA